MRLHNTSRRYGFVPVILHWSVVAGVAVQYVLAELAEHYQHASGDALVSMHTHQSLGIALLGLALVRVAWRLLDPPPVLPMQISPLQQTLARSVHIAFYVVLFAILLTGWALATADGQPIQVFGPLTLPQLRIGAQLPVPGGTLSKQQLAFAHEFLVNALLGLGAVHITAALLHQLLDRMGSRRGMLPRWRKRFGENASK